MPEFPGFVLTKEGLNLKAKCEAGAVLNYTKAQIGSGSLPPGGNAFSATSLAGLITIYNSEKGSVAHAVDGNTGFSISVQTQGASDTAEITTVTPLAASELSGGEYLLLHSPALDFHVWYRVDGNGLDPRPNGSIGVVVDVESLDSAIVVAEKTATAIDQDRTEAGDLVRLIHHEMNAGIADVMNLGNGTTKLPLQFSNEGLEHGFAWREIGIFAEDPDVGDILYSVTNAGDLADPVPAQGGATIVEYVLDAITRIGNITDVKAIVVPSSTYASKADLSGHESDPKAHGNKWIIKDSDYPAQAGDKLFVDTSGGVVPITVPEIPNINDRVDFVDYAKTFNRNKMIVKRAVSGEKIQGLEEDMDVDFKGLDFGLVCAGDAKGWVVV
jgi:hypothetical protein